MSRLGLLAALTCLALAAPLLASPLLPHAQASGPADAALLAQFDDTRTYFASEPDPAFTKGQWNSFAQKVAAAKRAYVHGDGCPAENILDALLKEASAQRRGFRTGAAEDAFNRGHSLRTALLHALPTDDCGIGPAQPPSTAVTQSTNSTLAGRIAVPTPLLATIRAGGEVWTTTRYPSLDDPHGPPGEPAVQRVRHVFGVPWGAHATVAATASVGTTYSINLIPFQPQPMDGATPPDPMRFADPPFTKNAESYASSATAGDICSVTLLGAMRDLVLAQLSCALGRYDPVNDVYESFDAVDFRVTFEGGTGAFLTDASRSPFESATAVFTAAALNRPAIDRHIRPDLIARTCVGEEYLILTHPDFLAAADRLAGWKNAKGISTQVFTVNDGEGAGPDTREAIDAFIDWRYDNCLVRPSYVLLLGDAEFIPTWYVSYVRKNETIGTDFPYAQHPDASLTPFVDTDILPDYAVGRMPVDTIHEANIVVNNTIAYESAPPTRSTYYGRASIASTFECCGATAGQDDRTYIQVSEFARDVLQRHGKSVERIYARTGNGTPMAYSDGTPLPSSLQPPFAWDGNQTGVVDALNDGRFLVIHRGHGWEHGWIQPPFVTTDLPLIENSDVLPVVWSVNCASGLFDNESAGGVYNTTPETIYWVEDMLRRSAGGAVAVLGATRDSPTGPNSALMRGFVDATWPDALAWGGPETHRRLGDVLNHAKLYLVSQLDVPGQDVAAGELLDEYRLWHVLGDPTLEMWAARPFLLPLDFRVEANPEFAHVYHPTEGAVVTVLEMQLREQGGAPKAIGRATVQDGVANVTYFAPPDPEARHLISASLPGAVSATVLQPLFAPTDDLR